MPEIKAPFYGHARQYHSIKQELDTNTLADEVFLNRHRSDGDHRFECLFEIAPIVNFLNRLPFA